MMKVTKKDQIKQYAAWLWQGVNAQICNVVAGGAYHIGIVTNEGSVEKQLTPCYRTIPELLAYLQGLHHAKQTEV